MSGRGKRMSEAGGGPEEMRRRLVERSVEDEAFRQSLLSDPKGAIEQELGARLPEETEIRVVEETPETIYLVLPPRDAASQGGGELSDRELEAVAGGWESQGTAGDSTCGQQITCVRCGPRA